MSIVFVGHQQGPRSTFGAWLVGFGGVVIAASIFALVGLPLLASVVAFFSERVRDDVRIVVLPSLVVVVASTLVAASLHFDPLLREELALGRFVFSLGVESGLALGLAAMVLAAVVRFSSAPQKPALALVALDALVLAHLAAELTILATSFLLLAYLVVNDVSRRADVPARDRLAIKVVFALGALSIFAAAFLAGGGRVLDAGSLGSTAAIGVSSLSQTTRIVLGVGVLVGVGVFPFSLHLSRVFTRASIVPAVATVLVRPVFAAVAFGLLPTFGAPDGPASIIGSLLAILGAAYTALCALAQRNPRAMLGYLAASQNGLVLAGLAARSTTESFSYFGTAQTGLACAGLLCLVEAIDHRESSAEPSTRDAFASEKLRVASLGLLLSLAMLGIPIGPWAFANDLLGGGPSSAHPALALSAGIVSLLNALALFRTFAPLVSRSNERDVESSALSMPRHELLGPALAVAGVVGSTLAMIGFR